MPRINFDAWLAEPWAGVAIVGATGWVGRAVLEAVLAARPDLPGERLRLFVGRERPLACQGRTFGTEVLDGASRLGAGRWLVVHAGVIGGGASVGGEVRGRNDALLHQVLDLTGAAGVERLVLVSSGAAGFADNPPPAKAAYARMKRDHEETAKKSGIPLLVPRVFNLGGPHMTSAGNYALGDFIQRLSRDGRLAIGAADPVFRSYVHVVEMAHTVLDMAVDGTEAGEPYDIGGAQVVELGELAREVAAGLGLPDAPITRPEPTGGAGDWYVGDGRRYQTALFRRGRTPAPLGTIVADTIGYLKEA
jgi:nucleoside-diphosphate-sugar epimerase